MTSAGSSWDVQRGLDLVLAAMLLALLAPLMALVALFIVLTSRGPALLRQTRVGRDGTQFELFKFRTMYCGVDDAEHRAYVTSLLREDAPPTGGPGGTYKLERDPRITPVGAVLRRTSIDELPQLFNVLRGEMSIVGPRPVLPWEAAMFEPRFQKRFEVRPGITGLWQVSGRARLTMRQALELDVEYVQRHTLRLDLAILAKTVPAVVLGRGAS